MAKLPDDPDQRHLRLELGRMAKEIQLLEQGWDTRLAKSARATATFSDLSSVPSLPPIRTSYDLSARSLISGGYERSPTRNRGDRQYADAAAEVERRRLERLEQLRQKRAAALLDPEKARNAKKEAERQKKLNAKLKNQAAARIQRAWKQKAARKELAKRKEQKERLNHSALKIQTQWRGHKARVVVQEKKKQKQEEERKKREEEQRALAEKEKQKKKSISSPLTKSLRSGKPPTSPLSSSGFDDDEDEPLTDEELAELKRQFALVDADHSGGIDRLEFAVFWNLVSDAHLSRLEADAVFDELDVDGSGALALEEFIKIFRILQKRERLRRSGNPADLERLRRLNEKLAARAAMIRAAREEVARCKAELEAQRVMQVTNAIKNAQKARTEAEKRKMNRELTQQEKLEAIKKSKEVEQRLKEVVSQKKEIELFIHKAEVKATRMDEDEANVIDEFTPEEIRVLKTQFEKVDTDKSGSIDKSEFAVFYNRVSIDFLSAREGEALFDQLDVDKSGSLTFDEFVTVYTMLQRRERLRKDPTMKERLHRLDEKLKQKAEAIALARKEKERVAVDVSVTRMLEESRRKTMHNQIRNEKQKVKPTPPSGRSATGSSATKLTR
jgi:Ca2+-binding EF-hand superfamily protein